MTTQIPEARSAELEGPLPVLPAHGDPIRIVPLNVDQEVFRPLEAVPAAAPPHLTYRGGPLLTSVEVFTVFWGAAWQRAPQSAMVGELNGFFDFVLASALLDQLAEYSVPGKQIGRGHRSGTFTLASNPPRVVSDRGIQHMLEAQISAGHLPPANPNLLYFVYVPPGVPVTQGGSRSCQAFCGYHSDVNGQIFYAAMPYPGCSGCTGSLQPLDALTSTSSHELCEAITDPIPGQGWYDDANGEIGDICAWKTKKLGQYTVQLEWSNQQGKCV